MFFCVGKNNGLQQISQFWRPHWAQRLARHFLCQPPIALAYSQWSLHFIRPLFWVKKRKCVLASRSPHCRLTSPFQPEVLFLWCWWSDTLTTNSSLNSVFPSFLPLSICLSYFPSPFLSFPFCLFFFFLSINTAKFLWSFSFTNSLTSKELIKHLYPTRIIQFSLINAKAAFPVASGVSTQLLHSHQFQYWLYYQSPQICLSFKLSLLHFLSTHCPSLEPWEISFLFSCSHQFLK